MNRNQMENKRKGPVKIFRRVKRWICLALAVMMLSSLYADTQITFADENSNLSAAEPAEGPVEEAPSEEEAETPTEEAPSEEEAEMPTEETPPEEEAETPEEEAPSEEKTEAPEEEAPSEEEAETPEEEAPSGEGAETPETEIPAGSVTDGNTSSEADQNISPGTDQGDVQTDPEMQEQEKGLRITEYAEDMSLTVFWKDNGDARGTRLERTEVPDPELYFRKTEEGTEEGEFVRLTAENMQELCLEEMPAPEEAAAEDSMVFSFEGTSLPVEIEETDGETGSTVWQVEWKFSFPELDGYELTEVTEEDLEQGIYDFADKGTGWYYVLTGTEPEIEAGIRIDAWSGDLEQEFYWVDTPDSGEIRPDSGEFPEVELSFSQEEAFSEGTEEPGEEPEQVLTADNMEQVGLTELPTVKTEEVQAVTDQVMAVSETEKTDAEKGTEVSYTVRQYSVNISGDSLPSRTMEVTEEGEEIFSAFSWSMELPQVASYTLLDITDEMLEEEPDTYFYAQESGAGTYYVAEAVAAIQPRIEGNEPSAEVTDYNAPISVQIHWLDNNDEDGIRPSEDGEDIFSAYTIQFAINSGEEAGNWMDLTQDTWASAGLPDSVYPESAKASFTETGVGLWTLNVPENCLPAKITESDPMNPDDPIETTLQWRIVPKDVDGYELTDSGNLPEGSEGLPEENTGWYYTLLTDFSFHVDIRWGTLIGVDGITDAILESFNFVRDDGNGQEHIYLTLLEMQEQGLLEVTPDEDADPDNPASGTVTIKDLPKYNFDGSRITYTVDETEKLESSGQITPDEGVLDEGDYFSYRFDNSNVATVGNNTEQIYNGGELILTLTGTMHYQAEKVWLDRADKAERPEGTFQLWRYRAGNSYTTASPVYGSDGKILTVNLNTEKDKQTVQFSDSDGKPIALEKFDSEGYTYIYVMREYLVGGTNSYEQVFGKVADDGSVEDFVLVVGDDGRIVQSADREAGNDFIYCYVKDDGSPLPGTISNRLTGSESTTVAKTWDASVFQTAFEDVAVEVTLQTRPADSSDETAWEDVATVRMEDFYAEHLTDTVTKNAPLYGDHGEKLEYRWVESGVYQGDSSENLLDENGFFTLVQNGKEVRYRSVTEEPDEEGVTVITNKIRDTIKYEAEKVWVGDESVADEMAGREITFGLYRAISGGAPDYTEPLYTFEMNGVADDGWIKIDPDFADADYEIRVKEDTSWHAVVEGLPEYDEQGQLYEYFLLELNGVEGYFPRYETSMDEDGNYLTTIYNGPGEGNHIIVQKYWTDGSDVDHREDITLEVYSSVGNKYITTATLENGVWNKWVSIGSYEPDEVYIVETKIGSQDTSYKKEEGHPIPTVKESGESNAAAVHQFAGTNHQYEATYKRQQLKDAGQSYLYSVTNRRLGEVNITVTKTWVDGDGSQRKKIQDELVKLEDDAPRLMLRLDFGSASPDEYDMTYGQEGGDTVNLGGQDDHISNINKPGDLSGKGYALLKIRLDEKESKYYFFSLPKYDVHGDTASYVVEEVWVNSENEVISDEEMSQNYSGLWEVYSAYSTTIESDYEVGKDTLHSQDTQTVDIENRLTGTKDASWKKTWNDEYTYEQGERPDIYLDIYRLYHSPDAETDIKLELYRENYRWTQESNETNTTRNWTAELSGLPKYDSYGYEIMYYAVERMAVDSGKLGYLEVSYSTPAGESWTDGNELGTMTAPEADAVDEKEVYLIPSDPGDPAGSPEYALKEGNMFTNTIYDETVVTVTKQWENMPGIAPYQDLPSATFYLYRDTDPGEAQKNAENDPNHEKAAATLTVEEGMWINLFRSGTYSFDFLYEGENKLTFDGEAVSVTGPEGENDPQPLRKYDEDGKLYEYVLIEVMDSELPSDNNDHVYQLDGPVIAGYTASNVYDSTEGSLSFRKYLELPLDKNGKPVYPAVEFEISRTYKTNNGDDSESETVKVSPKAGEDGYIWIKAEDGGNLIWSAEMVKKAAQDSAETGIEEDTDPKAGDLVSGVFVVKGLEKYAPNGSEYTYTIREVKDQLKGFDTWVVKEGLEESQVNDEMGKDPAEEEGLSSKVEHLTVEGDVPVSVTFINARSENQEGQILQGKKIWDDLNDYLEIRPTDITLTVTRTAPPQDGQGNGIEQILVKDTDYVVDWGTTKEDGDNEWQYTITGLEGVPLDRYAPNGMEWEYMVKETVTTNSGEPDYISTPENGIVGEAGKPEKNSEGKLVQQMKDLTNSITTEVRFNKYWVDKDGEEITEDYLGEELTVVFELQVREGEDGQYQSAYNYFHKDSGENDLWNSIAGANNQMLENTSTLMLTDRIDADTWQTGREFVKLPQYVKSKDSDKYVELSYRVVEKEIRYGKLVLELKPKECNDNSGYIYTLLDSPLSKFIKPYYGEDNSNIPNNPINNIHSQYNQILTTDFSVMKKWENDNNNRYNTRPKSNDSGYNWMTSFVIQRVESANDSSAPETPAENEWEIVTVGNNDPLIVNVYGKNEDINSTFTVSGLPQYGLSDTGVLVQYQYRARELKPLMDEDGESGYTIDNVDGYIVNANEIYASTYTASYVEQVSGFNGTVVTNRMNTTEIKAQKEWKNNGPYTSEVQFTLQYLKKNGTENGAWTNVSQNGTIETVKLDGKPPYEPKNSYYEYKAWNAKWTGLPEVMPGSKLGENNKTQYQVIETSLDGYVPTYKKESGITTITNRKVTSLTVEKIWAVADESEKQEVIVGLWRTTGTSSEKVPISESDDRQMTRKLNKENNWTDEFESLPEYDGSDSDAQKYTYYAREIQIGTGDGAIQIPDDVLESQDVYSKDKETGYRVIHKQTTDSSGRAKTTIYNIGRTDLTGTKTWKDDGNAYGTRPETLELTLQRTVTPDEETSWVEVTAETLEEEKASFEWSVREGDEWIYTYSDLLAADEMGRTYTYRVREEKVPEEYDSVQNGNNITNTLNDTIEITVTKEWLDGSDQDGLRPGSIMLILYRNGSEFKRVTLPDGNLLQRLIRMVTGSADSWSYTFRDLPEYDENGVRYQYTVKEASVPDGYQADGAGGGTAQGSAEEGFTVTNILTTEVKVQKVWRGTDDGDQKEVTVGLYRSTGGAGGLSEAVTDVNGEPVTLTLSDADGWKGTFENLPRFDEDGIRYQYTVKEELIGGNPAEESGFVIHMDGGRITETDGEQAAGTFAYTITNISETAVSGTKIWLDNHNAYGTRPEALEIKIYRSIEDGEEEEVTADTLKADGAVLVWTGTDTDVWTYTYSGLPLTDDEGNLYIYRVEEVIPDGYEADADGYDFTNTLTAAIDIPVTKVWEDRNNSSGKRPEEIELVLYANGVEVQRVKVEADTGNLEALWNQATSGTDNTWVYTFAGLPKYDENGAEIAYTVQEVVPDGYRVDYGEGDNTITNVKRGSGSTGSDDSSDEEDTVMAVSAAVPAGSVKTGDNARILLWTAAAVLSAVCLTTIGVYVYRRRKK